ncbi:MAG TPA: hypothetical protein VJ302_28065, partial [Blastocatellia bacterium]|nr:hypothetical protein [Blastocatellia bacterium]
MKTIKTMKIWRRPPSLMWLLIMALLTLLPMLAMLQYHWLEEVMKGHRERMKSTLQTSASQFGQEFDREVRAALMHFQEELQPPHEHPETAFFRAYRRWQATAAHPRLIGEIYRTTIDERGERQLTKYAPDSNRFEPSAWPENLKSFSGPVGGPNQIKYTQGIFDNSGAHSRFVRIEKGAGRAFAHILSGPIDGDVPGLIIPLLPLRPFSPAGEHGPPFPPAYLILMFDLDYLKREFIPELVNRHFLSEGRLDYYVA